VSRRRLSYSFVALALIVMADFALAQACSKGKPCGNTCIPRANTCRVRPGTAHWAPGADTVAGVDTSGSRPRALGSRHDSSAARILGAIPPARRVGCVVTSITDGDTFNCAGARRVRLLLIDAPERNQRPHGAQATVALARLIAAGDEVTLELDVQERDRYGRTLAYAWRADGRMVNGELARAGFVVVSVYPPNVKYVDRLRLAVSEARAARRGLWATNGFECLPAERRRGRC